MTKHDREDWVLMVLGVITIAVTAALILCAVDFYRSLRPLW